MNRRNALKAAVAALVGMAMPWKKDRLSGLHKSIRFGTIPLHQKYRVTATFVEGKCLGEVYDREGKVCL